MRIGALVVTGVVLAACGGGGGGGGGAMAPLVTGVVPPEGLDVGSTVVTVSGQRFAAGATLTLGGVAATNVVVTSPSSITAHTPAHLEGVVDVAVTNPDAQGGSASGAFTFVPSFLGKRCYRAPATSAQLLDGCPPAGTQAVDKGSLTYATYLVGGALPPLP